MELGPLPYPRKRTAPTGVAQPESGEWRGCHARSVVSQKWRFFYLLPDRVLWRIGPGPLLNHSRDGASGLTYSRVLGDVGHRIFRSDEDLYLVTVIGMSLPANCASSMETL